MDAILLLFPWVSIYVVMPIDQTATDLEGSKPSIELHRVLALSRVVSLYCSSAVRKAKQPSKSSQLQIVCGADYTTLTTILVGLKSNVHI